MAGVAVTVALLATACSSSGSGGGSAPDKSASPSPNPSVSRAAGPAASVQGPITGGKGIYLLAASPQINKALTSENEYFVSGRATSYAAPSTPREGRWNLQAAGSASYKTRIIARVPRDPKSFNGTVIVEWLNVSSGADADPDYTYMGAELQRRGYAWVGVSAQQVGIDGAKQGDIASQLGASALITGLRTHDPARYGSLRHPGDAYSYDIFTQVARALRTPGQVDVLDGLKPQRVIATGESQSAFRLTTYVNGVQPLTGEFDGFFIHSRGAGAAPLAGAGDGAEFVSGGALIRTDTSVPIMIFETETDIALLRYDKAEQPDTDRIRVWEVAGTSHADAFLVGAAASLLGCGADINNGPQRYVARAAIDALNAWVAEGKLPASAPRLEHDGPTISRDSRGIALGGIRTPPVDVPVSVQSGVPADASRTFCALFGSGKPFPVATLNKLYGTEASFVSKWDASADAAIGAGHVVAADRPNLVADARKVSFG